METQARSQNQKINTRSQKPHVPMQLKANYPILANSSAYAKENRDVNIILKLGFKPPHGIKAATVCSPEPRPQHLPIGLLSATQEDGPSVWPPNGPESNTA
ncbi:hypothetical protein MJG53_004760 [Ovis ammon polii x Ovis aries]|uniref:Uncharacterized protein n=1 Tax=Ovis ammon polii x Ovis aries TaxID=2918886 RepID=A0ACB9VBH0_9CETA|nr:hypothetical protein MJG53_004760 [Ovis ammon polii x Ovis aries]